MSRPRVLLAEDHGLVREAMLRLIQPECDLAGVVERGDELLGAARALRPDVVLLDISLPGGSGLGLLPGLRASMPTVAIVMLTTHAEPLYVQESMRRGADGYVLKGKAVTELLPAIREAIKRSRQRALREA